MDKPTARKLCELVAGIVAVDDDVHPSERGLLKRLTARLGLSAHGDAPIEPTLKGADAAKAIEAMPESVRQQALELVIEAAIVDGKVVPAEQQYLKAIARAMGITWPEVEQRIANRLFDG